MKETDLLESEKQQALINELKMEVHKIAEKKKRNLTFHIETYGCQMNARDSEKLAGILKQAGYIEVEDELADFVLYNTCTVRENANLKVYGHLGYMKKKKESRPDMLIGLCGCMMQEPEVVEKIRSKYKHVDLVFGTHNIFKLAELLLRLLHGEKRVIDIWEDTTQIVEELPSDRKYPFKAGVNITYGCNNFCTYCIVPYVRGRERSRDPKDIVKEIEGLVADGVTEVMLLGQNVNSYGKNLDVPMTFPQLLQEIEKVEGLERIRFMTPHPKDLSDELIQVMSQSDKICKHMHLPLQSGSSRLLEKMNRRYTKEHYLELVDKLRAAMPDLSMTTDIIVGFPGETEEDFAETLDVVKKVQYDSAYTFIYSKRSGTPAATMDNQVSADVVKERFNRLLDTVNEISAKRCNRLLGQDATVLVESIDRSDKNLVTGRLSNSTLVHFKGDASMIGTYQKVKLSESKGFYYIGELI